MNANRAGTRVALALLLLGLCESALAQNADRGLGSRFRAGLNAASQRRLFERFRIERPTRDANVLRVQEPATPPPPTIPDAPISGAATPATPDETNITVPAAERAFGGGEPTEAVAAEEEAEKGLDDSKLLMKYLGMEDSPVLIYGWIQNSYTGNANGNGKTRLNLAGVTPNVFANKWMGNQYYLVFENPVEQGDEINFGFRIDNMFGNDWAFNYMQGLLNGVFRPAASFAAYDPAQFYAEAHFPDPFFGTDGIDVKGGRMYSLAGYEVVPATGRPLLSVPYMFFYGQPFTHFGAMSTWHINEKLNIHNCIINGWDRWVNENYKWGYMGGFTYTFNEDKTNIAFISVWGPNQYPRFLPSNQQLYATGYINIPSVAGQRNPGYNDNDRTLFTTVITQKWTKTLTQVIETDQGWERNVPGLASPIVNGVVQNARAKSQQWQSFGNWFLYNFNDKLTAVWRSEIFWDQQGGRVALTFLQQRNRSRFVGDRFYEMTLGLIYKPRPYLWIRPEIRYDWSQYHPAYTENTRKSQLTGGFDVILLY